MLHNLFVDTIVKSFFFRTNVDLAGFDPSGWHLIGHKKKNKKNKTHNVQMQGSLILAQRKNHTIYIKMVTN